jgi:hypothetical protein
LFWFLSLSFFFFKKKAKALFLPFLPRSNESYLLQVPRRTRFVSLADLHVRYREGETQFDLLIHEDPKMLFTSLQASGSLLVEVNGIRAGFGNPSDRAELRRRQAWSSCVSAESATSPGNSRAGDAGTTGRLLAVRTRIRNI